MEPVDHLQRAVLLKGSQGKLAKAAGVTQTSIWKALQKKRVSAELAIRIDRATNGEVPRWRLRPDLFDAPTIPQPQAA